MFFKDACDLAFKQLPLVRIVRGGAHDQNENGCDADRNCFESWEHCSSRKFCGISGWTAAMPGFILTEFRGFSKSVTRYVLDEINR